MIELLKQLKVQLALVALFCFSLNWNTFNNKYALDDEVIIHQNLNVQAGVDGIGKILTTDAFQGYLDMIGAESPLTSGRFRPLSIITFAIEQSFFSETYGNEYRDEKERLVKLEKHGGTESEITTQINIMDKLKLKMDKNTLQLAQLRHVIQVLLFALSMLLLLVFLTRHFFIGKPLLALMTVLLFVSLPVHTEVIANIKSRDEIMSLMFVLLTLHYSFNYIKYRSSKNLFLTLLAFILALLSKEYAMILPILVVIGWWTVVKADRSTIINPLLMGLIGIAGLFVFIRFTAFTNSGAENTITDVLNDPYLYATPSEAFASKVAILLEYFRVMLFPKHLSSDYSYSHFSYITYAHWKFWVAGILYFGMGIGFIISWRKRSPLTFALAIFLGFFFLVNNLVFNIGATMGERLVYHSSLGLCLIMVCFGEQLFNRLKSTVFVKQAVVMIIFIPVLGLYSWRTVSRNPDWKTNYTLFVADVKTVPNSALANTNMATETYNNAFRIYSSLKKPTIEQTNQFHNELKKAIPYFDKAVKIHDKYVVAYQNRGLCYFYLGNRKEAARDWVKSAELVKGSNAFLRRNSYSYLDEGMAFGSKKMYEESLEPLITASKMNPEDGLIWNNLGGAYFMTGQFKLASEAFGKALAISPNLTDVKNGKIAADGIYGLEQKVLNDSTDNASKQELLNAYMSCGIAPKFFTIKF